MEDFKAEAKPKSKETQKKTWNESTSSGRATGKRKHTHDVHTQILREVDRGMGVRTIARATQDLPCDRATEMQSLRITAALKISQPSHCKPSQLSQPSHIPLNPTRNRKPHVRGVLALPRRSHQSKATCKAALHVFISTVALPPKSR